MALRIAFAGTAPIAADVLELLHSECEIALVISQPDRPRGRGRQLEPTPVAAKAIALGLPLTQPDSIASDDSVAALRSAKVDAVIVIAYGQIVPAALLAEFLMLNVHVSLLPKWRGAAPIERAIMAGDATTGVCIMRMEEGLDTGPVAARADVPIAPEATAGDVYAASARSAAPLVVEVLRRVSDGTATFTEQDHSAATYAAKISAADRALDITQPAEQLHNQVRALSPHIGAWLEIDGVRVTIWRTAPPQGVQATSDVGAINIDGGTFTLTCGDGVALEVLELQPAGKKRMEAGQWVRGLRTPPTHVAMLPA